MVGNKEKENLPLVVLSSSGNVIDVLYTNNKGYKKSIETGTLWCLFERTGRLLPYALAHTLPDKSKKQEKPPIPTQPAHAGGEIPRLKTITAREHWIEAVVETGTGTSIETGTEKNTQKNAQKNTQKSRPHKKAIKSRTISATERAGTADDHKVSQNAEVKNTALILNKLIDIIHKRRQDLPEGSYTAYLFKEGIDKIKKKLGEEAVELLISKDRGNTVYETADLIYHLLVFLESQSIELNEVLKELESRMDRE